MRVILAFDLDCFYAQVAVKYNPKLKGKPVAIRQKYITVTCNYEARKFGITKLCSLEDAKKRCPELVIVDGSDLTLFRQASEEIYEFWTKKAFGCPIERKGFDECFLDVTKIVKIRQEQLSPGQHVPFSGHIHGSVTSENANAVQMLAIASQISRDWREELRSHLGFTCCCGIATGKLAAKFAAEMKKPNSQSILLPSSFPEYVGSLPCRKLQGIGRTMFSKLLEAYIRRNPNSGLTDGKEPPLLCSHVRELDKSVVLKALDSNVKRTTFVYNAVRGIDIEPVNPSSESAKTLSQEETSLPHPTQWEDASLRLKLLCGRVLPMIHKRQAKAEELPYVIRVTVLNKLKFGNFIKDKTKSQRERLRPKSESRQRRILNRESTFSNVDTMFKYCVSLLETLLDKKNNKPFKLARINLAVGDFEKCARERGKTSTIQTAFSKGSITPAQQKSPLKIRPVSTTSNAKRLFKDISDSKTTSPASEKRPLSSSSSSHIDHINRLHDKNTMYTNPYQDIDMSVLEELPQDLVAEIKREMRQFTKGIPGNQHCVKNKKKVRTIDSFFKPSR